MILEAGYENVVTVDTRAVMDSNIVLVVKCVAALHKLPEHIHVICVPPPPVNIREYYYYYDYVLHNYENDSQLSSTLLTACCQYT